jgi:hypothetical protein
MDVITSLAYGDAFGFLDAEGDLYNYTKSADRFLQAMSISVDVPLLRKMLYSPLLAGILPKPTDKTGLGKVVG